jgi:hypothetical protein
MKHVFLFLLSLIFSACVFSQAARAADVPAGAAIPAYASAEEAAVELPGTDDLSYPACPNRFTIPFQISDDAFEQSFGVVKGEASVSRCEPTAASIYPYLSVATEPKDRSKVPPPPSSRFYRNHRR